MFKTYFKTAWRFLLKNKTFGFINVFGLAIGTLCCLYILVYVKDQYSYDKHHDGVSRIYRVDRKLTANDGVHNLANSGGFICPAMKRDFPEIEQYTRVVPFIGIDRHLLRYKDHSVYETNPYYVDSTFFEVFSYHFVEGNKNSLMKPYSVVLLKPTADKLFGQIDPVGKTITIDNTQGITDYTVTGIVDESLGKSHLQANVFVTMNSGGNGEYTMHNDSWTSNNYISSYVKVRSNTNIALFENKFPAFVNRYAGKELKEAGLAINMYLQPISSIHTTPQMDNPGIGKPVSPTFLAILGLIATLIQIIACINFMNLSTARASKRAREVGVRKVIGAGKRDLIRQFLGESFLLSLISVIIAFPLLIIALPFLNNITQADVSLLFLKDYNIWLMLASLVFATGLIAGSYPAFYLSAFRVVKVIKGNFTSEISAAGIRRSLVVFQFVLSIVLITGIVIIYSQLEYIKNKDLGFDKEQRLIFTFNTGESFKYIPAFMDDLRQVTGVKEISNSSKFLSNPALFSNVFTLPGQRQADAKPASFIVSDEFFVRANGIKLISGRDFRPDDSAKILVNETFIRNLGLSPLKAPGTKLTDGNSRVWTIAGVMKDFNFGSLHKEVEPFMLWMNHKQDGLWANLTVHTATGNYKDLLTRIETVWHKDIPGVPFEYTFLDEQVQKQYESDISMSRIINAFTLIAICISCLGLFGLAAFSAEQRNKEIGIRKVLGASIIGIVELLSKDFLKLVLIAFLIAIPIAWWAMNKWLHGFAFRIQISWWMFAIAGFTTVLIALLTVSTQAIKAAIMNPANSLRSE
ncbi:MAG TPA: ABC transporter permease [Puia sp.]|jgi:putative ABC transport system permease protein|nr:ABC transporter permease [Puia sp.]